MTTGLYTAATLDLNINTSNAASNLTALEDKYGQLLAALASTSTGASAGMQALATSIAEVNKNGKDVEDTSRSVTKMSASLAAGGLAVKKSISGAKADIEGLKKTLDDVGAEGLKALQNGITKLNFVATHKAVQDFETGTIKSLTNVQKSIEKAKAYMRSFGEETAKITFGGKLLDPQFEKQVKSALDTLYSVDALKALEAEEIASNKRRLSSAVENIKLRQVAEKEYTSWWSSELKKRDAESAASALRNAQVASKLTSRITSETLNNQFGITSRNGLAGQRSAMQTQLASAFGQIEARGGGNALAALEASAAKQFSAANATAWAEALNKAVQSTNNLGTATTKLKPKTEELTHAQVKWNSTLSNTHALARGLSGSLGMLWMTYGQMAPLLAGAALGGAFKSSIGKGSEFEYQLTFVKALGDESAESVGRLRDAALSLGQSSMQGPVELASGMRILAQAGLNAGQSLMAIRHAADLATVGEMSMEESAVTLVGVMNAFKLSDTDFAYIGDIFAKAAAVSQSSVNDMTNAMRTASVVGEQYNVSVGDTAAALTLLAKVNVKGTAAGTSFRNMMKELYSPVPAAAKMMEQLGLKTAEASGAMRPMADIIYDLKGKLEQFDKSSQVEILQRLFGERGAKEAIQMLSLTRDEWDKLVDSIESADGFMRNVASQLEATTKGAFAQAKNALEGGLIKAFDSTNGAAHQLAITLRNFATSDEFVKGLSALVNAMAGVLQIVLDLSPAIIVLGTAWAGLKIAMTISPMLISTTSSLWALKEGVEFCIKSFGGLTVASGALRMGLTALAATFGPAALLAGVLAGIYYSYKAVVGETPASVIAAGNYASAMEMQTESLRRTNEELEKQIRLKRTGSEIDTDAHQAAIAKIQADISEIEARRAERAKPQSRIMGVGLLGTKGLAPLNSIQGQIEDYQDVSALEKLKADKKRAETAYASAVKFEQDVFNNQAILSVTEYREQLDELTEKATKAKKSLTDLGVISSRLNFIENTDLPKDARRRLLREVQNNLSDYRLNVLNSGGRNVGNINGNGANGANGYEDLVPKLEIDLNKIRNAYSEFQNDLSSQVREGSLGTEASLAQATERMSASFAKQAAVIAEARAEAEKTLSGDAKKKALDKITGQENEMLHKKQREEKKIADERMAYRKLIGEKEVAYEIFIGKRITGAREQALAAYKEKSSELVKHYEAQLSQGGDVAANAASKLTEIFNSGELYADISELSDSIKGLGADVDVTFSELKAKYASADEYGIFSIFGTFQQAEAWKRDVLGSLTVEIESRRKELERLKSEGAGSTVLRDAEMKLRELEVKFADMTKRVPSTIKGWGDDMGKYFAEGIVYGFKEGERPLEKFKSMLKRSVTDAIAQALSKEFTMSIMASLGGSSGTGGASNVLGGIGNLLNIPGASGGLGGMVGEGLFSLGSSGLLGGSSVGTFMQSAGISMTNGAGMMANLSEAAGLLSEGAFASGIGAAAPYLAAAVVVADAIGAFGEAGGPQQGQYGSTSAKGYKSSFTMSGGDALGNQALAATAYSQAQTLFAIAGKSAADLVVEQGYKLDPKGSASGLAYRTIKVGDKVVSGGTFDGNNGAQWYGGNSDAEGAASYLAKLTSSEIKVLVDAIGDSGLSETISKLSANFSDLNEGITKYLTAQQLQKELSLALMTEDEAAQFKLAEAHKLLNQTFSDLGLSVPKTTAEFRGMVDALDLTSVADQDTLAAFAGAKEAFLLVADSAVAVADSAGAVADTVDDLIDDLIDLEAKRKREIQLIGMLYGESAALIETRKDEIAALDSANAAIQRHINVLSDIQAFESADLSGANALADSAYSALDKAVQSEIDAINANLDKQIANIEAQRNSAVNSANATANATAEAYRNQAEAASQLANEIGSIVEALGESLGNLIPMSVSSARSALASMRMSAQATGVLPDIETLRPVLSAVGQMQAGDFATALDYARAKSATGADITILRSIATGQKTQADANILALQTLSSNISSSVDAINSGFDNQISVAKAKAEQQIATLNNQLITARQQLEVENGIYTELKSVSVALSEFKSALAGLSGTKASISDNIYVSGAGATYDKATDKWRAKGDTTSDGQSSAEVGYISRSILNESGPMALYNGAKEVGLSLRDLDVVAGFSPGTAEKWAKDNNLPTFANGGVHSGGFRVVGEKGWELESTGRSTIYNQDQLRNLIGGNEMIAELKSLREEVARLREDNSAENRASVSYQRKSASILERVCPDGDALQTRAVA